MHACMTVDRIQPLEHLRLEAAALSGEVVALLEVSDQAWSGR